MKKLKSQLGQEVRFAASSVSSCGDGGCKFQRTDATSCRPAAKIFDTKCRALYTHRKIRGLRMQRVVRLAKTKIHRSALGLLPEECLPTVGCIGAAPIFSSMGEISNFMNLRYVHTVDENVSEKTRLRQGLAKYLIWQLLSFDHAFRA